MPMETTYNFYNPIQKESVIIDSGYKEYLPSKELRSYIACYWESNRERNYSTINGDAKRVVPDGCVDIIFDAKGLNAPFKGEVVGTMDRVLMLNEYGYVRNFGVRFFPGCAHLFIKIPLIEIKNSSVSLASIWNKEARILEELISDSKSIFERINIMDRYLKKILYHNSLVDFNLLNILTKIYESKGNIGLKDITAREIISQRQIHRSFVNWIGLNPKSFIKVIRLQNIYNNALRNTNTNIFHIALSNGYYDQSHFIKDFKKFYGDTPTKIFGHK